MTNLQIDLFWEEVSQIQQRHSLFFPLSQIKYISLQKMKQAQNSYFRRVLSARNNYSGNTASI